MNAPRESQLTQIVRRMMNRATTPNVYTLPHGLTLVFALNEDRTRYVFSCGRKGTWPSDAELDVIRKILAALGVADALRMAAIQTKTENGWHVYRLSWDAPGFAPLPPALPHNQTSFIPARGDQ